jgi:putative copper resistance protein D
MLEAGLIASRFLHYAAVMALFGVSLFPLYAYADRQRQWSTRLDSVLHAIVFGAAIAALLSGILWLAFTTAMMTGTAAPRPIGTRYCQVERIVRARVARAVGAGRSFSGYCAPLASTANVHRDIHTPLLAALLLASLAGVGHTQQNDGLPWLIHTGADGLHLLGAGAWLGGLLVLAIVLAPNSAVSASDQMDTADVLRRFSGMGYVAVAVLVASGTINGWYLVGSFAGLVTTLYGQFLLIKLCLFAGMLALAAANSFRLVPALTRESEASQRGTSLARLRPCSPRRPLGLLVIVIVSALGTMELPSDDTVIVCRANWVPRPRNFEALRNQAP